MITHIIINDVDFNLKGRLIFALGDFIERYFLLVPAQLNLSSFCLVSISGSF